MKFDSSKYPKLPGVYLMKDDEDHVIYVGKATSLRTRLSSYFNQEHVGKTKLLIEQIDSIEVIITKNEHEALILESNMIKSYQPRYNMVLKDDKHFSFLAITDEKFPRLLVARKNSKGKLRIKTAKLFGPFIDGSKRLFSARFLNRLFRLRNCKKVPKKECLQYHIGNCSAPCIGNISYDDYKQNIESLASVLYGKTNAKKIIRELEKRMKKASKEQEYERAAALRNQISSLEIFFDRQRVEKKGRFDEDYLWFEQIGDILYVQQLKSRKGVIIKGMKHRLEIMRQENPDIAFCMQLYIGENVPDRVYSNIESQKADILNEVIADIFRKPSKEKEKVLKIAADSLHFGEIDEAVIELKKELHLETNPTQIETFDVSTLFGEESVGSMVRFVNGKPDKSNYRKFKIKTVEGQDDCSMIREIVHRRYSRLLREESPLPQLVLIDGGPAQLNAAVAAIEGLGVRIPTVSLAKKEEEVYLKDRNSPLRLSGKSKALKLLQYSRDEAHRFAISFHRKKKRKKM